MLQALMGGLINVNDSRGAFAGDSAGQIDRVAPEVVDELLLADYPGDDRASTNADTNVKLQVVDREIAMEQVTHRDGQFRDRSSVIGHLIVESAGNHVGIADGLDFLHAILLGKFVKGRENSVEH